MVPKINVKTKTFKQKELNGNLHAKTKPKRNKHFKIFKIHTLICQKRAYNHKFTKLSYIHTNITKLKFNIRHYYVIKKRARAFCFVFFVCFLTFSTLCLSPTHKMENLKTFKKKKIIIIREQLMTVNIFVSSIRSKCTCFAGVVTVFRKTEYRHTR